MTPFQNTNIQVTKVEMKVASTGNVKYILTAQDSKKYYFYQKAKGVDSQVFQAFTNMQVKQGDTIAISFTEEAKSFTNQKGELINYTDRFIGSMREANGVPVSTPLVMKNGYADGGKITVPQVKYEPIEFKPRNFKQEGYEKCLWGYWLSLQTHSPSGITQEEMDLVWNVFNQIEQDADKRFSDKIGWNKAVELFGGDEPPPEEPNF